MNYMVNTRPSELAAGQYHVVVGEGVAKRMGLKRGDSVRIPVPNVSQLTPMGRIPSQRLFTVAGFSPPVVNPITPGADEPGGCGASDALSGG